MQKGDSSRRTVVCILAILLLLGHVGQALSQSAKQPAKDSPFDSWARWAVRQGQWKGPIAPWPPLEARPESTQRRTSSQAPVSVQANEDVLPERLEATLAVLEYVYAVFAMRGYPLPPADGGRGDTPGFDLYLAPTRTPVGRGDGSSTHAGFDAADLTSAYDAAIVHGRLDANVPETLLLPCVAEAMASAALLALDPAETASQRKASAVLFAYYVSGRFGCDSEPSTLQAHPSRGFATTVADVDTALLLGLIDARQRSQEGAFVADLWQFTRQTTADLTVLRASPTLWEAGLVALANGGERPDDLFVELTTARYFSGPQKRRAHASYPLLRALPAQAQVPVVAELKPETGPAHIYAPEDLFPLGSAYIEVLTPAAGIDEELRVWLRGDPDARWTLTAMRLDADGREQGRMATPPRTESRGYLPLLLTEETAAVVLIVTRLLTGVPDRDQPQHYGAGYKLIVERSSSAAPAPPGPRGLADP